MQIPILPMQEEHSLLTKQPQLLYTAKLNEQDFRYRRNMHSHPNIVEFVYVLKGSGEYDIAGSRYSVSAGDLVIYNNNVTHCESSTYHNHSILCCAATNISLVGFEPNYILPKTMSPVLHLGDNRMIYQQLIQSLWDISVSGMPHAFPTCQHLFQSLLLLTLDIISSNKLETTQDSSQHFQLAQQIRAYVDSQPVGVLSAPNVAKEFQISESYCARVFKQAYNCSLVSYLIQKKVGEAQNLLLTSDLSIKEIGERVGYHNQSYFSKIFTQTAGISPLRYQKMYCYTPTRKTEQDNTIPSKGPFN